MYINILVNTDKLTIISCSGHLKWNKTIKTKRKLYTLNFKRRNIIEYEKCIFILKCKKC